MTDPLGTRRRTGLAFELEVRRPIFGEEGELIHRASRAEAFVLRDGAGVQAELLAGTAVDVALAPNRRGSTEEKASKRLTRLLTEAGLPAVDARTTDNHYVWVEGLIGEGDEVVVYGQLRPERDEATAYRDGGARFVIEAPPDGEVVIVSEKRGHGGTKRRQVQRARSGSPS